MLNKINKKIAIIIVCFIYIFGIGFIYFQSSLEKNRIAKERENFYIVMDDNNKDILKIEKKYFLSSEIHKIQFTKIGDEKVYTIEDKNLIEDIMTKIDFGKLTFDESINMPTIDLSVKIINNSNIIEISLSSEDKVSILKYNDSTFLVRVDEEFYNFTYDLFAKISS